MEEEEHSMHIALFNGKSIRKKLVNNEWFFSVVDIIHVLTESQNPRRYWSDLKIKLKEENFQLYDFLVQLRLKSGDGKEYETDCANTEGILRIIQSVPSKRAEPLKRWLARVGYDRLKEIENPELAQDRMKEIYEKKGYSSDWIDKRLRGIAVRQTLTDEWKKRGVKESIEFAILTNEISKATFGKSVEEYKNFKGLKNENLRDHMKDIELIFSMLGEASTTEIERTQNPERFEEHLMISKRGGEIARTALKELESETGQKISSSENYLFESENVKKKKKKIIEVRQS